MSVALGWCSPLPPTQSGIADFSAELLPALAARCDVTCFVVDPAAVAPDLKPHLRLRPLDEITDARDVLPVYHVGNHAAFHGPILRAALRRPGVLVLHEVGLYDLLERVLLGAGQAAGFAAWIRAATAEPDRRLERAAVRGRVSPHDLPLCEPLVNASRLTVTFNSWARDETLRRCPDATVVAVPQHALPAPADTREMAHLRGQYGLPPDAFVVGSFGHLTPAKRPEVGLAAFARLRRDHPDAVYVFVGPTAARVDAHGIAQRLGVADAVRTFGYVSETMWWDLLACTDLCVSLRGPTHGETSASLLKQLSAGKSVCVSAAGPDLAYPGESVCHIPQGDDEIDQLWLAMRRALADAAWRARLGSAARAYVREHHAVSVAADAMLRACHGATHLPEPRACFDLEAALARTRGVAAAWNRWWYRARLARSVGRRHGWGAVVRGAHARARPATARGSHAHSH